MSPLPKILVNSPGAEDTGGGGFGGAAADGKTGPGAGAGACESGD
jgi:hypothetical protein